MTNVLITGRGRLEIDRRRVKGSVKTKAETGVMQPNAKEDPRIPHQQNWKRPRMDSPLFPPESLRP